VNRIQAAIAAGVLCAILAGCNTLSQQPTKQGQSISLNDQSFSLTAKVAVKSAQGNETFRLRWQRRGDLHRIEVFSPLGSTVAEIFADREYAELWRGKDEPPQSAKNLDALLAQTLGIPIESEILVRWIHGVSPLNAIINSEGETEFAIPNWAVVARYMVTGVMLDSITTSGATRRVERLQITQLGVSQPASMRLVIDEYDVLDAYAPSLHQKRLEKIKK
jgi:hypothetical protein